MNYEDSASASVRSLFELYSEDIFQYAWYNLGNATQAEDVVQEVFLRALRSWDTFRRDSGAKTWLVRIARNYIYDIYRRKKREREFYVRSQVPEIIDKSVSAETVVELEDALLQMRDRYREVIILRYLQDLSVREASHILRWSESKVRSTTHRAMIQLREILGSDSKGGERP